LRGPTKKRTVVARPVLATARREIGRKYRSRVVLSGVDSAAFVRNARPGDRFNVTDGVILVYNTVICINFLRAAMCFAGASVEHSETDVMF